MEMKQIQSGLREGNNISNDGGRNASASIMEKKRAAFRSRNW